MADGGVNGGVDGMANDVFGLADGTGTSGKASNGEFLAAEPSEPVCPC